MPIYVVKSKTHIASVPSAIERPTDVILKTMQAREPKIDWEECYLLPRGKHLCKYCGDVAEGLYEDLLCANCRECFGHFLYSEL